VATEVGKLVIELEARVARLESGLRRGSRAINRFEARASRSFRNVGNRFARLARRFTGIGVAVGGLAGAFGLAQFTRASIQAASDVETFRIRLRSLIGSADEANNSLARLTQTASKVAPPLREIIEGAATLGTVALGSATKIERLTAVALNIQAVTGLTLIQTAQNLQRALSAGLGAADLFRERGIKALLEGLTDFSNLIQAPLGEVEKAIIEVFGPEGVFGEAAEQFADTLPGAISRTGDALFNLRTAFGEAISPAIIAFLTEQVIPFFESLTRSIRRNEDAIRTFAERGLVLLARGFIFATESIANILIFFNQMRVTVPRTFAVILEGLRKLIFGLALVGPGVSKLLGIGAIIGGVPAKLQEAADALREFATAGEEGLANTKKAVNLLRGELLILKDNLDTFGAASSQRAEEATAAFEKLSEKLQKLLVTAQLIDDPKQLQARLRAQRQLVRLIEKGVRGRAKAGDPIVEEIRLIVRRREEIAKTEAFLRSQLKIFDDAIAAQKELIEIAKRVGGDVEIEQTRLQVLTRNREKQAAVLTQELLPAQREQTALLAEEAVLVARIEGARARGANLSQDIDDIVGSLVGKERELVQAVRTQLNIELENEKSLERQNELREDALDRINEITGAAAESLKDLGDTIGGVIGSSISDALLTAIRGGSVDFGEILASTAARLLEKSIDTVLTDLAQGLNDIIRSLGGSAGLGGAISSALGFGALLLAGALQDTEVETSAADVASAVTSTQAVRGVVAGPTQIAVAEIGRTIQEAFVETNLILRRMLSVLVDQRTLLAGGAVAAGAGSSEAFGAGTDEILSTVSASFV
jgi:hypothetical protein